MNPNKELYEFAGAESSTLDKATMEQIEMADPSEVLGTLFSSNEPERLVAMVADHTLRVMRERREIIETQDKVFHKGRFHTFSSKFTRGDGWGCVDIRNEEGGVDTWQCRYNRSEHRWETTGEREDIANFVHIPNVRNWRDVLVHFLAFVRPEHFSIMGSNWKDLGEIGTKGTIATFPQWVVFIVSEWEDINDSEEDIEDICTRWFGGTSWEEFCGFPYEDVVCMIRTRLRQGS